MHALLNALATQLAAHLVEVEGIILALIVSWIFSIPQNLPRTPQEWWTWFRDTLQGAVPMKFQAHQPVQPVNPTQAHDAPKEQ